MSKIHSVKIIQGGGIYELIVKNMNGIARIEDKSLEYENSFYSMFLCYDINDNLVKSIENCPVIVTYIT